MVTIDVAWMPQERIVPAAMRWLAGRGGEGGSPASPRCIVSLLKPHYELAKLRRPARPGRRAPLSDAESADVCRTVCLRLAEIGCPPRAAMISPLRGKGGNAEFLLHFGRQSSVDASPRSK